MATPCYNFVLPCRADELPGYQNRTLTDDLTDYPKVGFDWTLQTYVRLKRQTALPVSLSNQLRDDCINVMHSAHLFEQPCNHHQFIVCARADFPARRWAQFHLVQNQRQSGRYSFPVNLWVQPGLVPRDPARQGVHTVAYAGQTFNGNLSADEASWREAFAAHSLAFRVMPILACNDFRDVDVLIGIRSFDHRPYNNKPASKLVNAWHAHIPFLGGCDSAFAQVGEPGTDYLRVSTMEEAVAAVLRLRDEPGLYQRLVENGDAKAAQYNDEATLGRWVELLTGPVLDRFQRWQAHRKLEAGRFAFWRSVMKAEEAGKRLAKSVVPVERLRQWKQHLEKP